MAGGVLGLVAAGLAAGTVTASTLPADPANLAVTKTVDIATPTVGDALSRGDEDRSVEPAPTTGPLPAVVQSTADLLADLVAAVEEGDPDAVLEQLSPESDCDIGPGSPVESCEQMVGYMLAIGARLEARCAENDPDRCTLWHTTEAHAAMGYPDEWLPIPFDLDDEGRVRLQLGEIPLRSYVGSERETGRLWNELGEMRPDLTVTNFGPQPNDAESGAAVLAAAETLNDPVRIVADLQAALDEQLPPSVVPSVCRTQFGTTNCNELFEFLYALDADIDLECGDAVDGAIPCDATLSSDLHSALGSEPVVTTLDVGFRGGGAVSVELDLRFFSDDAVDEAFIEYTATIDGLFRELGARGMVPYFTEETAPAWLDAAERFAAEQDQR